MMTYRGESVTTLVRTNEPESAEMPTASVALASGSASSPESDTASTKKRSDQLASDANAAAVRASSGARAWSDGSGCRCSGP